MSTGYIDERAEESDEEDTTKNNKHSTSVDDEDSDDDEGVDNEYEADGFIVNDDDEEEEDVGRKRGRSGGDDRPRKKKKTRLRKLKRGSGLQQELEELLDNSTREDAQTSHNYDDGVSYDNEVEARDYAGADDEYEQEPEEDLELEPRKLTAQDAQEALKLIYGPDALKEQFLTTEDEHIRNEDAPERLIVRQGVREGEVSNAEKQEETEWIYENAFKDRDTPKEAMLFTINHVLTYFLMGRLDIPFVSLYRSEYFEDHLKNDQDLWEIFEWDERWCNLQSKKQNLQDLYKKIRDASLDETCGFSLHTYESLLRSANSMEDVNDLLSHYQLHFAGKLTAHSENANQSSSIKRPVRRDAYSIAKRSATIHGLVARFGFTPQDYAENLQCFYAQKPTRDDEERPSVVAGRFVNREFKNEESALKAARAILTHEIAQEPMVRNKLRNCYEVYGRISLKLTAKGESAGSRQLQSYKNVLKTPLYQFINAGQDGLEQFLQIIKDEQSGLVQITIDVDHDNIEKALEFNTPGMFLSDRSDMLATEWNEQRRLIFKDVIGQLQIPLQQYIKNMYTKKAATIVGLKCESKLEDMLMSGPIGHDFDKWEPEKIDEDELNLIDDDQYDDQDQHHVHDSNHYRRKSNKPARPTKHRILSICPESEGDRVTFVMLDEDGIVLDTVIWNHMPASLLKLQNMHHENKTQWQKQVSDFIHLFRKHDPVDAIAICITGMNAVRTREIIEYLLKDIRKEHLPLEYVPDHIAKIYESSSKAKREFPNQSLMVKRAVSIGRFLNDPLTEIAGLFNDVDQDILMYKFHPLQDMLSKELLMQFLEKAFVRVVNKVGLDINRVTQHKHLQSTARFVSGWGPRKADYILKWVAGLPNSIIMQRRQLIHVAKKSDDANPSDDSNLDQDEKNKADDKSVQGILGRNVFYVCAGFIKVILSVPQIRAASMGGRDVTLDVLDNTRIHPESYTYAVDMAVDALDGVRDSQTHLYVEKAMKDPTKLDDLDLDAHAEHLLSVKKIRKHTTLKNIKAEFHCGFKDPRNTYRKLSDNEVFDYVTGESDQTLNRNIMVHAQVIRISERGIKLALTDNPNITGFMKLSHLDSRDPIVCDSRDEAIKKCKRLDIEEGAVVECVILEVQKDRYSVVLSMNPHDMANAKNKDFMTDVQVTPRDVIRTGGGNNQSSSSSSSSSNRQRIKRSINHPSFRNFDYQQAMEYLNQQGQVGNVVIRPSSKGYDHLTITYMFFNQQIINLDVVEKDKQDQNSLGRILLVSQKQYSDLDEIVYKCVEMELEHARKLMEHAKFSELSNSQIEQLLLREKSENPRGIPYRIGLSEKHPGKFTIFYVPSVKVKQQIVSLVPDGYRYNHRVFKDAVKLLNAFKKSNDGKGSASSAQNSSSSSSHHHRQGSSSSNHHSSSGASSSRTHDNNNGRSSSSRQW